jgi:chemotaxis-related protein WspD
VNSEKGSLGSNVEPSRCWKQIGVFGDFSCPKLVGIVHCRNCAEYNKAGRSLFDREISGEFLKEWTDNLTGAKEVEALDSISVIVFRIKNEWLAYRALYLQETTNIRPVHRVPLRTNNVFKGVVNINGELLLCVSLADILEYAPEENVEMADIMIYKRMVVVNKGGDRYVFPVDEILGIYRISLCDLKEPPVTLSKSPATLIEGVFNLSQKKVGLLAEDKLINSLKRSLGD